MFTTIAGAKPPSEMEVAAEDQPDKITLIGPSFHGWTYRSRIRPVCYRLLPIDESPLKRRDEVRQWVGKEMPENIARVTKAWQPDDGSGYFYVRYEVSGLERTLTETLQSRDPSVRMDYAGRTLRALPGWWQNLHSPLLPMPADVVFAAGGRPSLLALPFWKLPGVDSIFAEPVRGLYLAPEVVCGRSGVNWQNVDRYAFGVSLLECFYKLPAADDAAAVLLDASRGTALAPYKLASYLPLWLEKVAATRHAKSAVSKLVAADPEARGIVDVEQMAGQMENLRKRMNPLVAAKELLDQGTPLDAFTLLQDVLLTEKSYDLLLLAGEVSGKHLNRPLEAVDLFERAMEKDPQRSEAYEAQFEIIAASPEIAPLRSLINDNRLAAAHIDSKIERDFQNIPLAQQQKYEIEMAVYLLWREQSERALAFIYPRLFDDQTYMWWKFGLNMIYAEALISQGRLGDAQGQLAIVKSGLLKARQNRTVDEYEIHQHGEALVELEAKLFRLNKALPNA